MSSLELKGWRVGSHDCTVVVTDDINAALYHCTSGEVDSYGGALVCESIKHPPIARLIAAAPALLEALRSCERVFKAWVLDEAQDGEESMSLAAARKMLAEVQTAIALAGGGK